MSDILAVGAVASTASDFLDILKQLNDDVEKSLGEIVPVLLKELVSLPSVRLSFSRTDIETLNKRYRSLQAGIQKLGEKHVLVLSLEEENTRMEKAAAANDAHDDQDLYKAVSELSELQSQLDEQRRECSRLSQEVELQRDQLQQQRNNSVTTDALVTTSNTKISADQHLKLVDSFNMVGRKFLSALLDPDRPTSSNLLDKSFMELEAFRLPNGSTDFCKVAAAANELLRISMDKALDAVQRHREGFIAGFGMHPSLGVSDSIQSAWRRLTEEHLEGVVNFPKLAGAILDQWQAALTPSIFTVPDFIMYPTLWSTLLSVAAQAARLAAWCAVANDNLRVHCPIWTLERTGIWVSEDAPVLPTRGLTVAGGSTADNIRGLYPIGIFSDYREPGSEYASMWAVPAVIPDRPVIAAPVTVSGGAATYAFDPTPATRSHSDVHAPSSSSGAKESATPHVSSLFATAPAALSPSTTLPRAGSNASTSADPHASSLRGTA